MTGGIIAFENLHTYLKLAKAGKADEFHARYDEALKLVRGRIGATHGLLVDGREVPGKETFADTNPSNTDELLGRFALATKEQVDEAVAAAKREYPRWSRTHYEKRADIFERAADLLAARRYEFAAIMTLENGKNRLEAMADVDEAVDFLRYYCHELRANHGYERRMGAAYDGEDTRSLLRPYGVWAVVAPFNFPLAITCGMTAGAVLTGNTAVVKPASDTPWVGYALVKLLHEAGVPGGAVNFVTGSGSVTGNALTHHPDVAGAVFTGSRDVGTATLREFTKSVPRPFIAEMGGKNAVIVSDNVDVAKAAEAVAKAAFGFGGQKCSAASRAYVHERVHDAFLERLVAHAKAVKVGNPEERDNGIGPLINAKAVKTFEEGVAEAKQAGARVLAGGTTPRDGKLAKGHYVTPTVVAGLPSDHALFARELFVPFIVVGKYSTFDEALAHVNRSEYGLTAGLLSDDEREARRFLDEVEAGVVYVNRARSATTGAMVGAQAFTGWKLSGSSGKGAGGAWYLPQFLREQSRTVVR